MVFILSEVGLPKDYTRPTSSGKQFYRNKFTLTATAPGNTVFASTTNGVSALSGTMKTLMAWKLRTIIRRKQWLQTN